MNKHYGDRILLQTLFVVGYGSKALIRVLLAISFLALVLTLNVPAQTAWPEVPPAWTK